MKHGINYTKSERVFDKYHKPIMKKLDKANIHKIILNRHNLSACHITGRSFEKIQNHTFMETKSN